MKDTLWKNSIIQNIIRRISDDDFFAKIDQRC